MSWISGTISLDLQDIVRTPDPTARVMWLSFETQFLENAQTRALQLDAELRTLEQGDLSVSDYCRKMKSTAHGPGAHPGPQRSAGPPQQLRGRADTAHAPAAATHFPAGP
jgi:hypothetical protein